MSFPTLIFGVFLPVACIAAATGLMRLFDVMEPTAEQVQSEVEKMLGQDQSGSRPKFSGFELNIFQSSFSNSSIGTGSLK